MGRPRGVQTWGSSVLSLEVQSLRCLLGPQGCFGCVAFESRGEGQGLWVQIPIANRTIFIHLASVLSSVKGTGYNTCLDVSEVVRDQEGDSCWRAGCPIWLSWIGLRRKSSELRQGVCVAVKVVSLSKWCCVPTCGSFHIECVF